MDKNEVLDKIYELQSQCYEMAESINEYYLCDKILNIKTLINIKKYNL